jgi:hypothetical protein
MVGASSENQDGDIVAQPAEGDKWKWGEELLARKTNALLDNHESEWEGDGVGGWNTMITIIQLGTGYNSPKPQ